VSAFSTSILTICSFCLSLQSSLAKLLFDAPKGPPPAKRVLAAAFKAREQAEALQAARASTSQPSTGAHLMGMNQPTIKHESDGDSLGSVDLFDAPKEPPPAKRLLATVIKAREQADRDKSANRDGRHWYDHNLSSLRMHEIGDGNSGRRNDPLIVIINNNYYD
jgi:hypothetical protein